MIHCFDLDGTLIDSNGIWEVIDLHFLGRHGLTPTEEYGHVVGHSIFPIAAEYTRTYYHLDMTAQEIMDEWLSMAREEYARVPLKPGAAEYLDLCAGKGEPLSLITACVPELCRSALDHHGLSGRFHPVIFAQELGREKRDPEVYRIAAQRMGVRPEDCVLYEDAPANCAAAKAAGMKVVGVRDRFYAKYEAEMRSVCHRYIDGFPALLN